MTERGLTQPVRRHAAPGESHRLAIVDELQLSDWTLSELQETTCLPSNVLASHHDVLEDVGLVARRRPEAGRLADAEWRSSGHDDVEGDTAPFVSTFGHARAVGMPGVAPHLHWSVLDTAGSPQLDHDLAVADIAQRVERLTAGWRAA